MLPSPRVRLLWSSPVRDGWGVLEQAWQEEESCLDSEIRLSLISSVMTLIQHDANRAATAWPSAGRFLLQAHWQRALSGCSSLRLSVNLLLISPLTSWHKVGEFSSWCFRRIYKLNTYLRGSECLLKLNCLETAQLLKGQRYHQENPPGVSKLYSRIALLNVFHFVSPRPCLCWAGI